MIKLIHGDSNEVLKTFPENHFDSLVRNLYRSILRSCGMGGKALQGCQDNSRHLELQNLKRALYDERQEVLTAGAYFSNSVYMNSRRAFSLPFSFFANLLRSILGNRLAKMDCFHPSDKHCNIRVNKKSFRFFVYVRRLDHRIFSYNSGMLINAKHAYPLIFLQIVSLQLFLRACKYKDVSLSVLLRRWNDLYNGIHANKRSNRVCSLIEMVIDIHLFDKQHNGNLLQSFLLLLEAHRNICESMLSAFPILIFANRLYKFFCNLGRFFFYFSFRLYKGTMGQQKSFTYLWI